MNLVKQQDKMSILRNERHSCIATMKQQKQKSGGEIPFAPATTKNKLSKNNRRVLRKLHNTEERN